MLWYQVVRFSARERLNEISVLRGRISAYSYWRSGGCAGDRDFWRRQDVCVWNAFLMGADAVGQARVGWGTS